MAGRTPNSSKIDRVATVEISDSEMQHLSSTVLVARLVSSGVSRLTAERFIEIQRGSAESGRARPHAVARR